MSKNISTLCIGLFICKLAAAQINAPNDNIIPPAPEAAALGKYIEVPVSLYTGIPDISIPITMVRQGVLSLPVSLSYHAGGNKPDEVAQRTGLGWSLNAGGVVTRVTIGRPDESAQGFLNLCVGQNPNTYVLPEDGNYYERYKRLTQQCDESQPDIFYFNMAGYTGKFSFDWDGSIKTESSSKVKITYTRGADFITKWEIITADGTKYIFDQTERSESDPASAAPKHDPWCEFGIGYTISTWHLTKIISANGNDFINFEYGSYTLKYYLPKTETLTWGRFAFVPVPNGGGENVQRRRVTTNYPLIQVTGAFLKKITTSDGLTTINFIGATPRTDIQSGLPDGVGAYAVNYFSLDTIKIFSGETLNRNFLFKYNYNTGRLTLAEVRECGGGNVCNPPYKFEYSPVALPAIGSFAQDHWGYYNGAANYTTLLPEAYLTAPDLPGGYMYEPGADREVNPAYAQAGILKKIVYPSGGYTAFTYESNDYSYIQRDSAFEYRYIPRSVNESLTGTSNTVATLRTTAFTVNYVENRPPIKLQYLLKTFVDVYDASISPRITIKNSAGTVIFSDFINRPDVNGAEKNVTTALQLDNGTYQLVLQGGYQNDQATANLSWTDEAGPRATGIRLAGGLRVRQIQDVSGSSDAVVRVFDYHMDHGTSSGVIFSPINYRYSLQEYHYVASAGDAKQYQLGDYDVYQTTGRAQLGTTAGSHIGYRIVTVMRGAGGENGKSVYTYSSPFDFPDQVNDAIPFAPPSTQDHVRGLLKQQTDYKNVNGSFVPVRQLENDYVTYFNNITGHKVGVRQGGSLPFELGSGYQAIDYQKMRFAVVRYTTGLGISKLKTSKETIFENGKAYVTETNTFYDAPLQFVKSSVQKVSNSKELVTDYFYPQDFTYPSAAITELKNRHTFPLLEQITYERGTDGIKRALSGAYMEYALFGQLLLPSRAYRLTAASPISNFATAAASSSLNPAYIETKRFDGYDAQGNIVQARSREKENESYLWGYNKTLLVARVQNAPLNQIAYCDFEDADTGGFSFNTTATNYCADSKTGKRSYKGATISYSNLPQNVYRLSLWAKAASGNATISVNGMNKTIGTDWTYCEWEIVDESSIILNMYQYYVAYNGSLSITTDGNLIDGIRLHPKSALMETYTYDPLVGITSVSTPNNTVTYYEYDALGRLSAVRDDKRNILKAYQYQFANQ